MKQINSQCQMVKFAKFAENLTATQSMKEKETYIGYKRRQYKGI